MIASEKDSMNTLRIQLRGFTLVEILIAAVVLSLFMTGLFSLFRSGQKASGQAFWIQKVSGSLRNTTRHISQTVQKSSYPSTFVYPGDIKENTGNDFRLHYSWRGTLFATQSASVTVPGNMGTQFLRFVESFPEKQGFAVNSGASLTYHIYSLSAQGRLIYHRFEEVVGGSNPPLYNELSVLTRPTVPPAGAVTMQAQELSEDVESITVSGSNALSTAPSILVDITCRFPRGDTRRSEQAVVVPNVQALMHSSADVNW